MAHLFITGCLLATTVLGRVSPVAPSAEERFAHAQGLFNEAMSALESETSGRLAVRRGFYEAAREFAALFADGIISDHVCVNAGNAYHFAGDNARALLWYLRAVRLTNSPEARAGLASLRRASDTEPWPPEQASILRVLMSWHHDLRRSAKQMIVLATYPSGCLLVIIGLFVRHRMVVRRVGILLLLVGLVFGVSDLVTALGPHAVEAVVVEQTQGYAGNAETYTVIANNIRPGQEARLLERREGWMRIELPSGVACWVPAGTCEAV